MRSVFRNVTLWSLTLGHFCTDMLAGAMPIAIGLYVKEALGLSLAQTGFLLSVYALTSSLTQPLFGYLSDRYGGRWFAVGGVLWMAILQGLVGFMPTFNSVLLVSALAGFGSAAFHPQGASGANQAAGANKNAGVAMFMLGGNLGFAVGPILAAAALGWMGVQGTAILGLITLAIVPLLYALTGQAQAAGNAKKSANWKIEFNPLFTTAAIVALILVMSLRAWSQQSFSSFLPQYFVDMVNFSKPEASLVSTVMLAGLALGTLTGGMLADRVGANWVMSISMLISTPLMALMFMLGDTRVFWVAPVLGFFSGAAWPPMLVLAQSLFHKNAGVGSGVALGFVFAIGGLGLQLTGWLAEPAHLGFYTAMMLLCVIPVLTAALVIFLPTNVKKNAAAAAVAKPAGAAAGD